MKLLTTPLCVASLTAEQTAVRQRATERIDPCKSHPSTGCHAMKSLIRNPARFDRAERQ